MQACCSVQSSIIGVRTTDDSTNRPLRSIRCCTCRPRQSSPRARAYVRRQTQACAACQVGPYI
jgi:hypothetical protein